MYIPFSLAAHFVSTGTPFAKFTRPNLNRPGVFNFTSEVEVPSEKPEYKGKVVVLINEFTQSAGEFAAMSLQASNNVILIGSQTAGADGDISKIYLPGGLMTMISGAGVYYPDGTGTQRIGIIPDKIVKPTVQGIRDGKDEVLLKAIQIIHSSKAD